MQFEESHRALLLAERRAADEEDVAHSVMRSFCSGAMKGHFKELHDRDGLWALLLLMTRRKVVDYWRRETRARRGRGKVRGDSAFDSDENPAGFDGLPGPESLPQLFAVLDENLEELRDDTLRTVAILRLRGYELEEIAAALGVTARTVRRKLDVLHTEWSANAEASA